MGLNRRTFFGKLLALAAGPALAAAAVYSITKPKTIQDEIAEIIVPCPDLSKMETATEAFYRQREADRGRGDETVIAVVRDPMDFNQDDAHVAAHFMAEESERLRQRYARLVHWGWPLDNADLRS